MSHLPSAHVTSSLHSELLPALLVIGTHFVLHYKYVLYNPISFIINSCFHVNVRFSGGMAWVNRLGIVIGVGNVQGNWILKLIVLFKFTKTILKWRHFPQTRCNLHSEEVFFMRISFFLVAIFCLLASFSSSIS